MTDNQGAVSADAAKRTTTLVVYGLYAASILVGITSIVGVIIAHVKRPEMAGTIYESHLTWLIRTFWIGLAAAVVGSLLSLVLVGFLILAAVAVWFIYRVVVGFLRLNDNRPIEDPTRWF